MDRGRRRVEGKEGSLVQKRETSVTFFEPTNVAFLSILSKRALTGDKVIRCSVRYIGNSAQESCIHYDKALEWRSQGFCDNSKLSLVLKGGKGGVIKHYIHIE